MSYPMYFTYTIPVQGEGFSAVVSMHGRCLAVQESGGWAISGVQPGAIGAKAAFPQPAINEFRAVMEQRLFNMALNSDSLELFENQVRAFFADVDSDEELKWQAARQAIRDGRTEVAAPFRDLRKEQAEPPCGVRVTKAEEFSVETSSADGMAISEAA